MKIACGITTAPRDGADYLPRTYRSLYVSGFDPVIFAEPSTLISFDSKVVRREQKKGVIKNWAKAAVELAKDSDAVLMCQDDVVFCSGLRDWIAANMWPSENTGVVSLYCPAHYSALYQNYNYPMLFKAPVLTNVWGACALLMPSDVAIQIAKSGYLFGWPHDQWLDRAIGMAVEELGLDFWFLTPSLSQHVGEVSSIEGHRGEAAGRRAASTFVGENATAEKAWPRCWKPQQRSPECNSPVA